MEARKKYEKPFVCDQSMFRYAAVPAVAAAYGAGILAGKVAVAAVAAASAYLTAAAIRKGSRGGISLKQKNCLDPILT